MHSIIELKKELVFNREMSDLIDILKKTAVSQFQTLFNRHRQITTQERYLGWLEKLFERIDFTEVTHPFFNNLVTNVMCIIITSDMGFLGGLNSTIGEEALRHISRKDNPRFFVLGEKGKDFLTDAGKDFAFLPAISDEVPLRGAEQAAQYIFVTTIREKIGRVIVTYPKFFSFAHQEVDTVQLFPRQSPASASSAEPVRPPKESEFGRSFVFGKTVYEPFLDKVLDYLVKKWLTHRLNDIFWHSKLSEFAARATHLEGSIKELEDMKKTISFQYFRTKHELTDRNLRDIFGGRLASNRIKLNRVET